MARSDPLLPLSTYRSEGWLTEIRMPDLAFTAGEAAELFGSEGLTLAPATVDALTERTHGWAAGLRFAAMSLSGHPDPESAAAQFRGDRGTVAEYLLAEVLGRQSPEARSALLRTSVLDVLRPGLVDELGGEQVADLLRSMAEARAFVEPVPTSPGSFRYHALFRELLRAQLAYESPDEVAALRRQSADVAGTARAGDRGGPAGGRRGRLAGRLPVRRRRPGPRPAAAGRRGRRAGPGVRGPAARTRPGRRPPCSAPRWP